MPPAAAIATLLSSLSARFHSAAAAFSFCPSFPSLARLKLAHLVLPLRVVVTEWDQLPPLGHTHTHTRTTKGGGGGW